ncbi:2-oxo-4-hydroxy-4-carboxy--5-ureidoimidazoline (OHCU) decarboxylase [Rhizobium leguminosarum]
MVSREDFVSRFGGVFEHSPFIAARAYDAGPVIEPLTAAGPACVAYRHLPRGKPAGASRRAQRPS